MKRCPTCHSLLWQDADPAVNGLCVFCTVFTVTKDQGDDEAPCSDEVPLVALADGTWEGYKD